MSTSSLSIVKTQIFLNGPKDWDEWIMLLKFAALNSDVWKYVNPETLLDKLPKLIEPVRPTLTFVQAMKLSTLSMLDSSSTPTEAEDPVRLTKS
jgi:hypothetical protein